MVGPVVHHRFTFVVVQTESGSWKNYKMKKKIRETVKRIQPFLESQLCCVIVIVVLPLSKHTQTSCHN